MKGFLNMRTDDFDFYLPEELIAQTPILNRSESKLLVLDKETGEISPVLSLTPQILAGITLVLFKTKISFESK